MPRLFSLERASEVSLPLRLMPESWLQKLFRIAGATRSNGPAAGRRRRVLGTSSNPESKNIKLNGLLSDVLKNSEGIWPGRIGTSLEAVGQQSRALSAAEAGFYLAAGSATGLPDETGACRVRRTRSPSDSADRGGGLPVWFIIGAGLACGLLLVDAWWIIQTRRNLAESERKLSESFTALSDLNLQAALVTNPQGMLGDLYPRLNEGLNAIQKGLEAGPVDPEPEGVATLPENVGADLKQIEHQAAVFCAFDAADSAQKNLNRLAAVLSRAFEMRTVTFFSYFGSALRNLPIVASTSTEQPMIEWKEGPLFDALSGFASTSLIQHPGSVLQRNNILLSSVSSWELPRHALAG